MKKFIEAVLGNAPACALLGSFFGIAFMVFIGSDWNQNLVKYGTYGLSAFIALFASAVALAGSLSNIDNQNRQSEERRLQSLRSSNAMLPVALSELNRICKHNALVVLAVATKDQRKVPDNISNSLEQYESLEIVNFADGKLVDIYQSSIEFADPASAKFLSYIIQNFQIAYTRTAPKDIPRLTISFNEGYSDDTALERAFDWAILSTLVSHCYKYARNRVEKIPNDLERSLLSQTICLSRQDSFTIVDPAIQALENYHLKEIQTLFGDSDNTLGTSLSTISIDKLAENGWL